jgi:aminoglycoside phosphotransferase (APT) family kinase protein
VAAVRMHADELEIDVGLVRLLLDAQLPQWSDLRLEPVVSSGSDNAMFRLGDDMSVRLPRRRGRTEASLDKEIGWLPKLAPLLPLPVPAPLAVGAPGEGYPCRWAVYRWLEGEAATLDGVAGRRRGAEALAEFLATLQRIDAVGGPPPGEHNFFRGVPLVERDDGVRSAIAALAGELDVAAVTAAWDAALETPEWDRPPVWVHGDFCDGNLLAGGGRFSGVIDWGGLAVADPACDLIAAWSLLTADARDVFRAQLGVDDATWARGRGWALSVALIAIPYYRTTNPARVAYSWHRIGEVLADQASG